MIEQFGEIAGYGGLGCAAGAGVAFACHREKVGERFEAVEERCGLAAVFAALVVAFLPIYEWTQASQDAVTHVEWKVTADGTVTAIHRNPGPPPSLLDAGGHFLLFMVIEIARDMVVLGFAFGVAWCLLRLVRGMARPG